jgi:hypothetical protein
VNLVGLSKYIITNILGRNAPFLTLKAIATYCPPGTMMSILRQIDVTP